MRRIVVVSVAVGLFASGIGLQADEAAIKINVETAKTRFAKESDDVRASVFKELDRREAAARKKGDAKTVQAVQEQYTDYEKSGILPRGMPKVITRKLKDARRKVQDEFEKARKGYLDIKADELASATERDVEAMLKAADKPFDPLIVGSEWQGPQNGVLADGKPIPDNGGTIRAAVSSRIADGCTIIVTSRKDLVFHIDLKQAKDKWSIEKMVADPAGRGTPGPLQVKSQSVEIDENTIRISVEVPNPFMPGTNKVSYLFSPVK